MRLAEDIDRRSVRQVAEELGLWSGTMDAQETTTAVADALDALYQSVGMPTRVGQLGIPRKDLLNIARETVKNFNANSGGRSKGDQIDHAARLLEAAW